MPVTKKQRDILDFLIAFIKRNRYSPTYEEIRQRFGYRSLSTVHKHVRDLEDKGLIRTTYHHRRSIEIVRTDDRQKPYRSVIPPKDWLCERADDHPIPPTAEEVDVPLHLLRRARDLWRAVREQMLDGDELWTFRTPEATWEHDAGRAGYALIRDGEVVDGVLTWDCFGESNLVPATD